MDVTKLDEIRAKLLREAIKAKNMGLETKPSIFSVIYPATKHGPNFAPARHDPQPGPEVNDHGEENEGDQETPEEEGPGTSKSPGAGDFAHTLPWPGGVRGKFLGKSYRSSSPNQQEDSAFVRRCIAAITSGGLRDAPVAESVGAKPEKSSTVFGKKGFTADKAKFVRAVNSFKKPTGASDD